MNQPLRIVHLQPLAQWIRDLYVEKLSPSKFDLVWAGELDDRQLRDTVRGATVMVTGQRRVTGSIIRAAGATLRLVQVQGRAPWAVDRNAARAAGVAVSILPHRGAIAVAEHAFALMLGVMRKLLAGHAGTTRASYRRFDLEPRRTDERTIAFNWLRLVGVQQLHGKTLGLIGLGDIGLEVARRARAFDMNVLYTKRHPLPGADEEAIEVRHAPLQELLARSDVVSIHAPHTSDTERIIDASALARMQPHAVLINTARGGLVDEDALVTCLRHHRIAGAGLDVFVNEPLPAGHPLIDLDNVLLSPHLGGAAGGGQKGMVADIVADLERISGSQPPPVPDGSA